MPTKLFDDLSGRPNPSPKKIGPFEILAELGRSDILVIYKARDPFLGPLVALETLTPEAMTDPENLKRFYRDAQVGAALHHPNLVTVYELREADGLPYFALEYVECENLWAILKRRAQIPFAAKLKLIQQLCEGLSHAHKHGFVLRNVQPANIMVTNEGMVKVMNFSNVHLQTASPTRAAKFRRESIHYISPELINEERVDPCADIWSVACVTYELIAYKKAFDGSILAAVIANILNAEPEPLSHCCPGVPVELDAVIGKGMKKNPDERYPSLDALLADLLPIARRVQQTFIDDLIQEAKDLRDKGDLKGAQEKVRAVLILANCHEEARRLSEEISAKTAGPGRSN